MVKMPELGCLGPRSHQCHPLLCPSHESQPLGLQSRGVQHPRAPLGTCVWRGTWNKLMLSVLSVCLLMQVSRASWCWVSFHLFVFC